ncbi:MAG: DUF1015 domain-containing protein [Ruminococcus sp.]|nr:DUF1015 domain-containing protein [Ruminococcus sp.]
MNRAFKPADILLPKNVDMKKWATIACDQYTSEPEYWENAYSLVGDSLSTLKLILPEIYLNTPDVEKRIESINENMSEYLSGDVFEEYKNAFFYVERVQSNEILRQGIIGMIDLEEYDYSKGSQSLVRATEATVLERIPPRIKVRENASIELPHIMILIDDEDKTVIEPVGERTDDMKLLYDISLSQGGGSIKGYLVNSADNEKISAALDSLADANVFEEKYKIKNASPLVFAMGDGNHSLATAKTYYEQLKAKNPDKDLSCHPARYALVEIVNLHSEALQFEAIHRFVKNVNVSDLLENMKAKLSASTDRSDALQSFKVVTRNGEQTYYINKPVSNLTVGSLQSFLDEYLSETDAEIDYIHGTQTIKKLVDSDDKIGFILPDIHKSELFPTVIKDGVLPRKTFSMGHAEDKRYYIECRKIV